MHATSTTVTPPATLPEVQTARLPGGIELPYVAHGPDPGMPVVLLHGYSDHWRSWEPVLPHLPPDIRAYALTLRGHGEASKPAVGYTPTDLAADVLDFLDLARIERAVLVGHSMGTAVGLCATVMAPDRVAGLVLGAPFAAARRTPGVAGLSDAVHALTDPIDPAFPSMLQAQAREPHLPPGLFDAMVQQSLRVPARVWQAVVEGLTAFDMEHALPRIQAPVTLAWGDQDAIIGRPSVETLVRGLPDVTLRHYAGGGHTPHWDDPHRFADDIAAMAGRVRGRAAGSP